MGRRLAEDLSAPKRFKNLLADAGVCLDPEVCAAAGLAHDLGHPPFGHVTEKLLNKTLIEAGNTDGFEGNPQSFHIVTRLARHRDTYPGLDLTRATLAAILKYPILGRKKKEEEKKFGAYRSDKVDFKFAIKYEVSGQRSLEAGVMNYADDIAYSVHDFEDFLRAGLLPLNRILKHKQFERFLEDWKNAKKPAPPGVDEHEKELHVLLAQFASIEYDGTVEKRATLRAATSVLIGEAVRKVNVEQKDGILELVVPGSLMIRLKMLQRIVWVLLIENPRVSTQQEGQKRIVKCLFECFSEAAHDGTPPVIPAAFAKELDLCRNNEAQSARLAADVIASLTDAEAAYTFRRISGVSLGSVLDRV